MTAVVKYLKDGKETDKAIFINTYNEPEQVTQQPSEENKNNNETITIIPEEEPPKTVVKQPQNQNKNNGLVEIEDEPVPKAIEPSQTGDSSNIFIYLVLFIISGLGLLKRSKNNK